MQGKGYAGEGLCRGGRCLLVMDFVHYSSLNGKGYAEVGMGVHWEGLCRSRLMPPRNGLRPLLV